MLNCQFGIKVVSVGPNGKSVTEYGRLFDTVERAALYGLDVVDSLPWAVSAQVWIADEVGELIFMWGYAHHLVSVS